jgi:hypothetical protein
MQGYVRTSISNEEVVAELESNRAANTKILKGLSEKTSAIFPICASERSPRISARCRIRQERFSITRRARARIN